jgi:hypothetical protein
VVRTLLILAAAFLVGCGPPNPQSADIVESRESTVALIEGALDELAEGFGATTLAESRVDACYEGQRNYKVDTGYSHRCSLRLGLLVGFDGDFRAEMTGLEDTLEEQGWQASESLGELVGRYWDLRAGEASDGVVLIDRLPSPNSISRGELTLELDFGGAEDDSGRLRIDRAQQTTFWSLRLTYENTDLFDIAGTLEGNTYEHLVLFSIEGHYFSR